jgi:hypothetical protein
MTVAGHGGSDMMAITLARRIGAVAFAALFALVTLMPTDAEAGKRHRHRGAGVAAAAVGIGVLGVLAATAAANARECWYERQKVRTRSGRVVVRDIKVCD